MPPNDLVAVTAEYEETPAVGGLTAELVAKAAHDLWAAKRLDLNMPPAPPWEALPDVERLAKLHQASQLLRVMEHARRLQEASGR